MPLGRFSLLIKSLPSTIYVKSFLPAQMQMQAPTVETIRLPINPEAVNPRSLNTRPPTNPPPIPRRIFLIVPDFSLISLLAMNPAIAPSISPQIIFIAFI